jgi:succinate dehydrogenase hydrophobic anchor subunit
MSKCWPTSPTRSCSSSKLLFVILATVHALLGVRAIIIDLRPSAGTLRLVNWGLVFFGAVAIGYGIWLAVALQRLAG